MFSTFRNAAIAMVVASALAPPAFADLITFETAPFNGFAGPVTENGFTYSKLSGFLFVAGNGNPGRDMEGGINGGGGVLKIVSATGGNFIFNGLDFAAQALSGTQSQTLQVEGFLGGAPVGTDQYTLPSKNSPLNWTAETASVLAGITVSELDIPLQGGVNPEFDEDIDNVSLTSLAAAVPEPASLTLLLMGLASLAMVVRLRRG